MNKNLIADNGDIAEEYEYFKKLLEKYNLSPLNIETYRAIRASSIHQAQIALEQTPLLNITDIILVAVLSEDIIRFKQTL